MKNHHLRALRYLNHMQRLTPNTELKVIAFKIIGMFRHGLPQGWGQ
jgi:hypothetical protein